MRINRYFSKAADTQSQISLLNAAHAGDRESDNPVWQQFTWTRKSSKIVNPDGSVVFEAPAVEVPEAWSQVAVDILAQKYFRKAGVPVYTKRIAEE